eukprot:2763338-Pleurochrysis_carterae.AAC.1
MQERAEGRAPATHLVSPTPDETSKPTGSASARPSTPSRRSPSARGCSRVREEDTARGGVPLRKRLLKAPGGSG